jgi:4-amino-4-deoxy-L-arabinose transferase-like glycosyltransferase
MSQQVRYQLWIVAAAGVIFLTNLGGAGLWDMDEALYSTCAREMLQRGNWVVPWFNGEMFPEKPPVMFWTMMAGFGLFGDNEFGVRVFSAVYGIVTALLAFHLGRILFNVRVGLWAGLITASTIIFTVSARAATVDSALTLATTAAFLFLALARRDSERPVFKLRYAVPMYACIGVAVLAKGPVGMLLPLAAMGLYLLVADGWRNVLQSAWWMRPFTAVVVIAAVAVPWYAMVGYRTDGEWLRKFFIEFNLRPLKQPILGHGDTSFLTSSLAVLVSILYYFYHVPAVLVGFFPWSVFLGPTLIGVLWLLRKKSGLFPAEWRDGCLMASCWFGVWFIFWSICKTKLPHYLLPAYPALALVTACFVDRWLAEPLQLKPWWLRNAWISMMLAGLAMAIAVPIVASLLLPGEEVLGLVGLIPLAGGVWCRRQTARGRHQQAIIGFAVTAVLFLTVMFGWGVSRVDRHQNSKPLVAAIEADSQSASAPIATFRYFRESIVHYAGHPVSKCNDDGDRSAPEKLQAFLANPRPSYVVTITEHLPGLEKEYGGQYREIFRQRCFGDPDPKSALVVLKFQ